MNGKDDDLLYNDFKIFKINKDDNVSIENFFLDLDINVIIE